MSTADCRMEIVNILVVSGYVTSRDLAQELGICVRAIRNDIVGPSNDYPIYTKKRVGGGILIMYSYKPYNNTLTSCEKLKKCMIKRREKKIFWNVFYENKELII